MHSDSPSCLQITRASEKSNPLKQMVPHIPLYCTSTRPSLLSGVESLTWGELGCVVSVKGVSSSCDNHMSSSVLTSAYHSCFISMATGSHTPPTVATVSKRSLTSIAAHKIHPEWTHRYTKHCINCGPHCVCKPKLAADDFGIVYIPFGVTHSTPLSKMENLHSAFWTCPTNQTNFKCVNGCEW